MEETTVVSRSDFIHKQWLNNTFTDRLKHLLQNHHDHARILLSEKGLKKHAVINRSNQRTLGSSKWLQNHSK